MKLKDEVGMGGPKSTQTRFVYRDNHVHYSYIPTLAFLDYHVPVDGDLFVLSLTKRNLCDPLLLWFAGVGVGGD